MANITKKQQAAVYNAWKNSRDSELYHVYKDASALKWQAMEYCKKLCRDLDGHWFRIIGHNCMTFSVAFIYADPETGEEMMAYITRDYDRFFPLDPSWD